MKTKLIFSISIILCFSMSLIAQTDKEKYWILEDFSSFDNNGDWIDAITDYDTYPNNVKITTYAANIEASTNCAASTIPGGNQFRIRGLASNGYLQFTVPNASIVKIYVSGKSDMLDRTVRIYRNGILAQTYEDVDRTICCKFVDEVNSSGSVTYKVTGGNVSAETDPTAPVVVYYVEVLKYGQTDPQEELDASKYWVKEDFSQFNEETDYNTSKTYTSYPNNINLRTIYSNIELNGDCARANVGYGKQMRIRGYYYKGALEFEVPNAGITRIYVTGKSSIEDRLVNIYRNGELVKTYSGLDKNICRIFTDSVFSTEPVSYKITGEENASAPIAIYNIEVEKYYAPSGGGEDFSDYWIYEDFNSLQLETGYSSNVYETFPHGIEILSSFANIEQGDGCTMDNNIVRISSREGEDGSLQFTVPDYGEIAIGLTGKSTFSDREIYIYMNDQLVKTISSLDRNNCEEFFISEPAKKQTTIKITGGNNAGSPAALNYIRILSYDSGTSVEEPDFPSVSVFPNPVADVVYFRLNNADVVQQAKITDLSGRQILSATGISEMNVSSLSKGIYIIQLQMREGIYSYKLVKK
jgi:hypothetical protein